MPTFNVHLFPVMCKTHANIEADSPEGALQIAREQFLSGQVQNQETTFAEEFSHYAVDRINTEGSTDSFSYYSQDDPLMSTLRQLADWHDHQRNNSQELVRLVAEVKSILATTI